MNIIMQKKRNSQYDLSLEELEECISKEQNVENQIELRELKWLIARFIENLPKKKDLTSKKILVFAIGLRNGERL